MPMTLLDVRQIADVYLPPTAGWINNLYEEWGPAHELGHLLTARTSQIHVRSFGLGSAVAPQTFKRKVYELAASIVHTWILVACKETALARYTWHSWCPDWILNGDWVQLKPWADGLLWKRRLTPARVQSRDQLIAACRYARRMEVLVP